MIGARKAIRRALDLAAAYRRRREAGTATAQDLVDLVSALAEARRAAGAGGDPGAGFVVTCLAASLLGLLDGEGKAG